MATHITESRECSRRLSVLLLGDNNPAHANAILDHIGAFVEYSHHDIHVVNPRGVEDFWSLRLDHYDVVVIHYSLCVLFDAYLSTRVKKKLKGFRGFKVQFIQDDYRWVDAITDVMREIGIDVLFTLVPESEIDKIWTDDRLPDVAKVNTLAGYIPERLVGLQTPRLQSRPLDIGYRGRILPYWLGRIGQEKAWIGQGVLERADQYGLRCDISWKEEDRIYGKQWDKFVSSCKATLGTESGATITDFNGSVEQAVREYLTIRPGASFDEVYEQVLHQYEGNVRMNIISPRIFESICLRTALILFPGSYSGILQPWKHYLPLEKDFSNMSEVVTNLRDMERLQEMTDRAYEDIVVPRQYSYQALVRQFDQLLERRVLVASEYPGIKSSFYRLMLGRVAPQFERAARTQVSRLALALVRLQHLAFRLLYFIWSRLRYILFLQSKN